MNVAAVRKRRKLRARIKKGKRRVQRGASLSRKKRRLIRTRKWRKKRNRRLSSARRLRGFPSAVRSARKNHSSAAPAEHPLSSAITAPNALQEHSNEHNINASPSELNKDDRFSSNPAPINFTEKVNTKLIAFYLPQFHSIPENDEWWGEGFTEWTNTKKARPLYRGHYQPREPFQFNYYDLRKSKVQHWQARLARDYGIYGFCYYHYWFKGKLLLETPLHNMLASGEPDFPFCLSWANEPWTRNWDGRSDQVLIPQEYGSRRIWKEHFHYLLNMFNDPRYIRVNNKPLFIIYRAELIEECKEMLEYWQRLARRNGLEGIYFVETMGGFPLASLDIFDARLQFEPMYTTSHDVPAHGFHQMYHAVQLMEERSRDLTLVNYDAVWTRILERTFNGSEKKIYLGGFVDWDNTARRGKDAFVFQGASPEKFGHYLRQLVHKANQLGNEFTFINAWNEWAEGTYLEPDQKYGYAYLEKVKQVMKPISKSDS